MTTNTSYHTPEAGVLNLPGLSPMTTNSMRVIQSLVTKILAEAERMGNARLYATILHDCNSLQMTIDNAEIIGRESA